MKPQSFALQVANWCLLGVGLFILGFSRNHILAPLGASMAGFPIMRAYKMAKDRRLQRYGEEIERRMQQPPN